MTAPPAVHDLVRVAVGATPLADAPFPDLAAPLPRWARSALLATPWVVVRRVRPGPGGALPVGVRGRNRSERVAAWLPVVAVVDRLSPEQLTERAALLPSRRCAEIPALGALDRVRHLLVRFGAAWGPGGSIGFELATGVPTAHPASDLDLVVRAPTPMPRATAVCLLETLAGLPARADVQLETPHGAVALAEYARGDGPVLQRTPIGPRLTADPWRP